eukprot:5409065-Prymnesium_polylepis.1
MRADGLREEQGGCACRLSRDGTRARRGKGASGVPRRGHTPSRHRHGLRVRHARVRDGGGGGGASFVLDGSIVASIRRCHRRDPGSIPGQE